jgi:putative FmdB family regulatory protein
MRGSLQSSYARGILSNMPTYTYRCSTCELVFEATQSIKDDALTTCNCGKAQPVQKVFTPVGVTFKGSGFYKTDARTGKATTAPAGGSSDAGSSDAAASGTSSTDSSSSSSSSSESSAASTPAPVSTPDAGSLAAKPDKAAKKDKPTAASGKKPAK